MTVTIQAERTPLYPLERDRLIRQAKLLAWSSLVWMTVEGVVAVVAGITAVRARGGLRLPH